MLNCKSFYAYFPRMFRICYTFNVGSNNIEIYIKCVYRKENRKYNMENAVEESKEMENENFMVP